jgi:hypothetical protein
VRIRRARADERERLREIARTSKGDWGYDPERIIEWVADLDLAPEGPAKEGILRCRRRRTGSRLVVHHPEGGATSERLRKDECTLRPRRRASPPASAFDTGAATFCVPHTKESPPEFDRSSNS